MTERNELNPDDAEIAELLRSVGTRSEPSEAMMREVQAAVHAEWRDVVALRQRQRRTIVWAMAASVAALAVGAVVSVQLMDDRGEQIAILQRADGEVFIAADGANFTRMGDGQPIAVGDTVRSDARAAMQLQNGVALRMDRGTAFKVVGDDRLELNVGALYVDAKPGTASDTLTIETHAGAVRHLGTQYQVRTRIGGIDIAVREGRVMVEGAGNNTVAMAGERLEVSMQGAIRRGQISPTDEQWRWASDVAPTFVIENASLAMFLDWIARETGRALVYESSAAKSTAAAEILHGSIAGLAPDVALAAVLATTPLHRDETNPEVIEIGFSTAIDSNTGARPTP